MLAGDHGVVLVEAGDPRHLVITQLEAEDVEVLRDVLHAPGPRQRHRPELDVPPQHHLPRRLAVTLADLLQYLIIQLLELRQRAVRLQRDALLLQVLAELHRVAERAPLDLVHRRDDAGLPDQLVDPARVVVADTDVRRHPLAMRLDQPLPETDPGGIAGIGGGRPVDQRKVHAVQAKLLELAAQRVERILVRLYLRDEEDILPADAGLSRPGDGLADGSEVAVAAGGVDEPVAGLEGSGNRVGRRFVTQLPSAEADRGHGAIGAESDLFHAQPLCDKRTRRGEGGYVGCSKKIRVLVFLCEYHN